MDDKPKCIWKKSLRGSRFFLIWLTLLVLIVLGFFIFGMTTNNYPPHQDFTDCWILFIFAGFGSLILLTFWAFIRWLCSWRNFKKFLFGGVCFVTLMALFYAEENWRGKHDWEKFKRAEEAKGEKFDWQSVIPPNVPDDQNFAFSPVWIAQEKYHFLNTPKKAEAWYGNKISSDEVAKFFSLLPVTTTAVVGTNFWESNYSLKMSEKSGDWQTAQFVDLKPWQNFYRGLEKTNPAVEISITPQPQTPAQDVLLALSKFDPVIEELRKDSARPFAQFPIQYGTEPPFEILLPHLAAVKQVALVLQLRAIAELQNGQSNNALDDIKLSLRLTDSIREPFIISHLVRIAIVQITLQPIYEGLAEHKWSDAQLAELDKELSRLDFLADYEFSLRGERTLAVSDIDYMRRTREIDMPDFSIKSAKVKIAWLIPSAFFYQNELTIAQMHARWTLPLVKVQTRTVSPDEVRQSGLAAKNEMNHFRFYGIFARMIFPAIADSVKRFAYAQSSTDLARVAIALERYRLAQGNFPESLDALAPQFLEKIPHDIINGEPLHYRKTADGNFVLYSVGWNERDDGGVVALKKGSTPEVDTDKGDWVWKYPQN
jgi:hypothetical protein